MENATKLGRWILAQVPYRREPMTHLKLQKLAFYCYGAALAFDFEDAVGDDITFEAWEHGPVCRPLWHQFRAHAGGPIGFLHPQEAPEYAPDSQRVMLDALIVYGRLTAWALRQESHTEKPWKDTIGKSPAQIPKGVLRTHFQKKFAGPVVMAPEGLSGASSARLDGIPTRGYRSLHELALAVASLTGARVPPRA